MSRDLCFLRTLVSAVGKPLKISISDHIYVLTTVGQKLALKCEDNSCEIMTNSRKELNDLLTSNSSYKLAINDNDLYIHIVEKTMKAVLDEGSVSAIDIASAVGLFTSEDTAENNNAILRLLKSMVSVNIK